MASRESAAPLHDLPAHCQLWLEQNAVVLGFVPHRKRWGEFSRDFDYVWIIDDQRFVTKALARRICSYLYELGQRFTTDHVYNCLGSIALDAQRRIRPEMVKRKRGRPPKNPQPILVAPTGMRSIP